MNPDENKAVKVGVHIVRADNVTINQWFGEKDPTTPLENGLLSSRPITQEKALESAEGIVSELFDKRIYVLYAADDDLLFQMADVVAQNEKAVSIELRVLDFEDKGNANSRSAKLSYFFRERKTENPLSSGEGPVTDQSKVKERLVVVKMTAESFHTSLTRIYIPGNIKALLEANASHLLLLVNDKHVFEQLRGRDGAGFPGKAIDFLPIRLAESRCEDVEKTICAQRELGHWRGPNGDSDERGFAKVIATAMKEPEGIRGRVEYVSKTIAMLEETQDVASTTPNDVAILYSSIGLREGLSNTPWNEIFAEEVIRELKEELGAREIKYHWYETGMLETETSRKDFFRSKTVLVIYNKGFARDKQGSGRSLIKQYISHISAKKGLNDLYQVVGALVHTIEPEESDQLFGRKGAITCYYRKENRFVPFEASMETDKKDPNTYRFLNCCVETATRLKLGIQNAESQQLDLEGGKNPSTPTNSPEEKKEIRGKVFITPVEGDLQPLGEELRNHFSALGYDVVPAPGTAHPALSEASYRNMLLDYLSDADLVIHLVDPVHEQLKVKDSQSSMFRLEWEAAGEVIKKRALRRYFVMSPNYLSGDGKELYQELKNDREHGTKAKPISGEIATIGKEIEIDQTPRTFIQPIPEDPYFSHLYYCHDILSDDDLNETITGLNKEKNLELHERDYKLNNQKSRQDHLFRLMQCDNVLLHWDGDNLNWLNSMYADITKALAWRGRPYDVIGIELVSPDHEKDLPNQLLNNVAIVDGSEGKTIADFIKKTKNPIRKAEAPLRNPYKGLLTFEGKDEYRFFGREEDIQNLLDRLEKSRLLAVSGRSGSGKSSLVKAGLLPALHGGYMVKVGSHWRVAEMRPGDRPLANLAQAFSSLTEGNHSRSNVYEVMLRKDFKGIEAALENMHLKPEENLLIVVDQFEELFTAFDDTVLLSDSEQQRRRNDAIRFVQRLLYAASSHSKSLYIILTLRSDFLGDCALFDDLAEAVNHNLYIIPQLERSGFVQAVEGPLKITNTPFENELAAQVANDATNRNVLAKTRNGQDILPVVQHALSRAWVLWAKSSSETDFGVHHLEAVGGLQFALENHAQEVFGSLPTEEQKRIAIIMFKAITTKKDGRAVRRKPSRSIQEIACIADVPVQEVVKVTEHFSASGNPFILETKESHSSDREHHKVDVIHESLMRLWSDYGTWIDQEAEGLQRFHRYIDDQIGKEDTESLAELLGERGLENAQVWSSTLGPKKTWAVRLGVPEAQCLAVQNLIDKSKAAVEIKRKKKVRKRRLVRIGIALGFILVALVSAIVFTLTSEKAHEERLNKRLLSNAQESAIKDSINVRLKRQLANAIVEAENNEEDAINSSQSANYQKKVAIRNKEEAIRNAKLAEVHRRDAILGAKTARMERDKANSASTEAKNQRDIAKTAKSETERLNLQELARVVAEKSLRQDKPHVQAQLAYMAYWYSYANGGKVHNPDIYLALSKASQVFEDAYKVGFRTRLYSPQQENEKDARCVIFNPDGNSIAIGTAEKQVIVVTEQDNWGKANEKIIEIPVRDLVFGKNGNIFIVGDAQTILVKSPTMEHVGSIKAPAKIIYNISAYNDAYSGEQMLAGVGPDGLIFLINTDGNLRDTLRISTEVKSLAVHKKGKYLAFGCDDGNVFIASLNPGHRQGESRQLRIDSLYQEASAVSAITFDNSGQYLAWGNAEGNVFRLRLGADETKSSKAVTMFQGQESAISAIAFDPNGKFLAAASGDHTIHLWSMRSTRALPIEIEGHKAPVRSIDFSFDSKYLVSADKHGHVKRWPTSSKQYAKSFYDLLAPKWNLDLEREDWARIAADSLYLEECPRIATPND